MIAVCKLIDNGMCYSALVERAFEKLGIEFGADPWPDAFSQFESAQQFERDAGADEIKRVLGLVRKPTSTRFKWVGDDNRIFPGYFTPVVVSIDGNKRFAPMRYRIRPAGSKQEVPSKFNLFNARMESLLEARSWKPLIGRNHAILPVKQIFEWINKTEVGIVPTHLETLKVAAIYDHWSSPGGELQLHSFAVITRPAPADILAIGHARCPVILKSEHVDEWLNPSTISQAIELLKDVDMPQFEKVA